VRADCYVAGRPPAAVAERMRSEGIVPLHFRLLRDWRRDKRMAIAAEEMTIPLEKPCERAG
jgi:hypothetical protein